MESVISNIEIVLQQFSEENPEDINEIILNKFQNFVTTNLIKIKDKRSLTNEIDDVINQIFSQEGHRYLYSNTLNAYYEIIDNKEINMIHSDKILFKLKQYVPPSIYKHRYNIIKCLKQKLKSNDILNWIPPYSVVQNYIDTIENIFLDRNSAYYLMNIIGLIILKDESILGDTHFWHGYNVESIARMLDQMIYEEFRIKSSFFSNLKIEYHSKMNYTKIKYLYFPNTSNHDVLKYIQKNIQIFLVSCISIAKNYPKSFWEEDSNINIFRRYGQKENIVLDYLENHVVGSNGLLMFDEIQEDFNDFLGMKCMPSVVVNSNDLKQILGNKLEVLKHGHQTYYRGKMEFESQHDLISKFLGYDTDKSYEAYTKWYKETKGTDNYCSLKQFHFYLEQN
jgi:hypothetical protein